MKGPARDTEAEAIAAWNARTPPASQSDERLENWIVLRRPETRTAASQSDEALVEELAKALFFDDWGDKMAWDDAADIEQAAWCDTARAILPLLSREIAKARAEGRREGIEDAAKWVQDNWPHDKRTLVPAIRALAEVQHG